MRTIQMARYWRFFWRRPVKANFSPRSTDSFAERNSLDFVRKYPLARFSIFLRRWRRLVPRLTRGMMLLFSFVPDSRRLCGYREGFGSLFTRFFRTQPLRCFHRRAAIPPPYGVILITFAEYASL